MGTASSKQRCATSLKDSTKKNNNLKDTPKKQTPVEPTQPASQQPVTMAASKQAEEPAACPHLPLLARTPGGALIQQPLPAETEVEGYETVHNLYNILNDGFRQPFLHMPEYILLLDTREPSEYTASRILTARPHGAIETDFDCSLESGMLKKFTHIVVYDDRSTVSETGSAVRSLASRLRAQDLDPVILVGGFEAFRSAYPFLCNDKHIRSERDRAREIRCYPSEILEGALYQGNAKHAASRDVIAHLGITHVLNVSTECDNAFPGDCEYLRLKYTDELRSNMKHRLPAGADFIAGALRSGGRVLVHCVEGISRSSTLTLAFLMTYRGWSLADGLIYLRAKRPKARPNRAFLIQLSDLERELFNRKISDVDDVYLS